MVIPAVVVLIIGIVTYQPPPVLYNVGVSYSVSEAPSPAADTEDEERYYTWLGSEYVVNGLADWISGNRFKTAVSAQLAQDGIEVPPGAIGVVADNVRSKLLVSITYHDPEVLAAIIAATTTVLTEQNADALPQLRGETAVLVPIDDPIINQIPNGIRSQLDLPLRIIVGLIVGIALGLVIEYFDPTLRERGELEALGLPILGEIPRK